MVVRGPDSREYMEQVIPALLRLKERFPKDCDWTVEEITERLHLDEMTLLTFDDAFIIVEEAGEYLHATIAAGYDGHTEKFFEYTDLVGELATNAGYKGFTFTTTRPGWLKLAKEAGFRIGEVTFIYEKTQGSPSVSG